MDLGVSRSHVRQVIEFVLFHTIIIVIHFIGAFKFRASPAGAIFELPRQHWVLLPPWMSQDFHDERLSQSFLCCGGNLVPL
ncbi:uncharacterized protein EI90DRAFT_3030336, partial [Cantharellus anzutake]|uniref:uncharacterized protein n=1 Tax=Cantharellus anzutake TaxID=1750568 RepID=UPI001903E3A2